MNHFDIYNNTFIINQKQKNMQEGKVHINQVEENQSFVAQTFPTNMVQLPSKGLLYDERNPLSQGSVEMKFMTAKEENILTTESYIRDNTVIDKFLQSMVISPKFNYETLLTGDKDALVLASRIYGYGEIYTIEVISPSGNKQKVDINLEEIPHKEINEGEIVKGNNTFFFKAGNRTIEFKLMTVGDQKVIDSKLKKKVAGKEDKQVTTMLEQLIVSIDGNNDPMFIRLFLENELLAKDSRAFRKYLASVTPGPNLEIELVDEATGEPFRSQITIGSDFFWPDSRV